MTENQQKAFKILINSKELYESCSPCPDGIVRIHDLPADGDVYEITIRKVKQ